MFSRPFPSVFNLTHSTQPNGAGQHLIRCPLPRILCSRVWVVRQAGAFDPVARNRPYILGTFRDTVELTTPRWLATGHRRRRTKPTALVLLVSASREFKVAARHLTSRVHAPPPPAMAAAAVTSPDPFTFHCPVAPLAAPVEADVDEFEFHVVPAAAAALSAADELFSGRKLVPLHRPAPASAPC